MWIKWVDRQVGSQGGLEWIFLTSGKVPLEKTLFVTRHGQQYSCKYIFLGAAR